MTRDVENALQGTTGNPKGVVLTQGALAAAIYSKLSGYDLPLNTTQVLLSYLPLAHIYGVNPTPSPHTGIRSHVHSHTANN
jgi:long-subunit acyl-CoA synthetase (AMP-forming)